MRTIVRPVAVLILTVLCLLSSAESAHAQQDAPEFDEPPPPFDDGVDPPEPFFAEDDPFFDDGDPDPFFAEDDPFFDEGEPFFVEGETFSEEGSDTVFIEGEAEPFLDEFETPDLYDSAPPDFIATSVDESLPAQDPTLDVPPEYAFLIDPALDVPPEFAFLEDPRLPVPPEYEFLLNPDLPVPAEFSWLFPPVPDEFPAHTVTSASAEPDPQPQEVVPGPITTSAVPEPEVSLEAPPQEPSLPQAAAGPARDEPSATSTDPVSEPAVGAAEAPGGETDLPEPQAVVPVIPITILTAEDTGSRTILPALPVALPMPLLIFVGVVIVALLASIPTLLRQRSSSESVLRELALTDDLTNLANRRRLDRDLGARQRSAKPIAVAMIDIDHFKRLNDDYGHATGDIVLQQVAAAISENLRADDVAYRYGGEEFCVLLPDVTEHEAAAVVDRVRRVIENIDFDFTDRAVTVSAGVATADASDSESSRDETLRRADTALYAAKSAGRNRVMRDSLLDVEPVT